MLVTASQEAGVLEEDEEQMLHRVFAFADLTAGQMMVPRTEMVAFAGGCADGSRRCRPWLAAATRVFRSTAKNLDDIVGVLHVTDLVPAGRARTAPVDLSAVAREAFTVPETMPADDCSREMRQRNTQLAIVIDEFGGTAGLVTFAGLMERIVGEVRAAATATRISVLADGSALVDGLALVADINAQFGLHIDEDRVQHDRRLCAGPPRPPRPRRRSVRGRRPHHAGRGPRRARVAASSCSAANAGAGREARRGYVGRSDASALRSSSSRAVRDHEQRRPGVGHDRHPERGVAGQRQHEKRGLQQQRRGDVRLDVPQRRAAEAQREGDLARSSPISATSAVSSAASLPAAPMAMPTSAAASAGASFTPSPTMATVP